MGRDKGCQHAFSATVNFNPLSPHGERLVLLIFMLIGIHFNPLSPHGERRVRPAAGHRGGNISIHSPRMGRDGTPLRAWYSSTYFNPLSPHGERLQADRPPGRAGDFNPLSPHGERLYVCDAIWQQYYFNPLSPHGERPDLRAPEGRPPRFQSTLPAWGET